MSKDALKRAIKSKVDLGIAKFNSIINQTPIIHVFADSHGVVFSNYKTFLVHPVGSATAYNLINENSSTKAGKKIISIAKKINVNEYCLLIFGEIDCRIHVYREYLRCSKRVGISKIISQIIQRYGLFIKELQGIGFNRIIISSTPPTSIQKNKYNYDHYAPLKVRIQITKEFNKQLKSFCKKNGLLFLDMHSNFETKKGIALDNFRQDTTHLNNKILPIVEEQINKLINKTN